MLSAWSLLTGKLNNRTFLNKITYTQCRRWDQIMSFWRKTWLCVSSFQVQKQLILLQKNCHWRCCCQWQFFIEHSGECVYTELLSSLVSVTLLLSLDLSKQLYFRNDTSSLQLTLKALRVPRIKKEYQVSRVFKFILVHSNFNFEITHALETMTAKDILPNGNGNWVKMTPISNEKKVLGIIFAPPPLPRTHRLWFFAASSLLPQFNFKILRVYKVQNNDVLFLADLHFN